MRAKQFAYLKRASHFWISIQFHFSLEENFLVLGGWVVWPGGLCLSDPPPPQWIEDRKGTHMLCKNHRTNG